MNRVPVCLVGCGGMGSRHVQGFAALEWSGLSNVELVAVCDVREDNAQRVAGEAEQAMGRRPKIFLSTDDAIADPAIAAFDVVTEAFSHLAVVLPALEAGKHVLCEKPLALTVRSCRALIDAAKRGNAVLATAENYRRDPTNRLAKAAIDSGLLGPIHLMVQTMIGGNDRIIITPWRHFKDKGAIGLDMGAHLTDIAQYYFGPFATAYGRGFIAEPVRRRQEKPEMQTEAYLKRFLEIPAEITATGEDSFVATYTMASGLTVQMAYVASGPGKGWMQRTVHGRNGSLEIFNDRTGKAPILHTADGDLTGRALADKVGFKLDVLTERLYGAEISYEKPWAEIDAGLLAIELHDFATAITEQRPPEVDGWGGLTAVASVLAAYESGLAGKAVSMDDVLEGRISAYQDDIDAALGLIPRPASNAA
ncbi:MAG: Gfo/Idh/MocA family oxidoreductase [Devosia sp.]|nr:Gfo/Idh/MocA family oxidoreductase [Devosia sp.]